MLFIHTGIEVAVPCRAVSRRGCGGAKVHTIVHVLKKGRFTMHRTLGPETVPRLCSCPKFDMYKNTFGFLGLVGSDTFFLVKTTKRTSNARTRSNSHTIHGHSQKWVCIVN
jgi:hypothetical protein